MLETYERVGLDYELCHYGASRLAFRGPEKAPDGPYIAVLGGNATFGKFVAQPYPELMESITGIPSLNLGCMHAGAAAFADDQSVLDICSAAVLTVVQITGAQGLDNAYYCLHPRRNDRFVAALPKLIDGFPGVDLTECTFVRHLLSVLQDAEPEEFRSLIATLKREWVRRMHDLLGRISGPVILLWMADRPQDAPAQPLQHQIAHDDLLFVDRDMVNAVRGEAAELVSAVASDLARGEGLAGKVYSESEEEAAWRLPGPLWHAEAATALYDAVVKFLPQRPRQRRRHVSEDGEIRVSRSIPGRQ